MLNGIKMNTLQYHAIDKGTSNSIKMNAWNYAGVRDIVSSFCIQRFHQWVVIMGERPSGGPKQKVFGQVWGYFTKQDTSM